MSTWISDRARRRLILAAVLAGLAGCDGVGLPGSAPQTARVVVDGRPMTIAGPPGFCVDPGATRDGDGAAFVLLGNCAAIAGIFRPTQPRVRAVLTATVAPAGETTTIRESLPLLDTFFRSAPGRQALSRSAAAASVQVIETLTAGDVFLIHARDSGPGLSAGLSADYWRSYFDLDGRIVSLSVLGFDAAPLGRAASLDTLAEFEAEIRRRNRGAAAGPAPGAGLGAGRGLFGLPPPRPPVPDARAGGE
jgi:hypothetical protein